MKIALFFLAFFFDYPSQDFAYEYVQRPEHGTLILSSVMFYDPGEESGISIQVNPRLEMFSV